MTNKIIPGHTCWRNMRKRCNNPNHPMYPYYGGRGITVCERWSKFANFLEDMGEKPEGLTLDRINSNGNYEPSNCRWATRKEQVENRAFYGGYSRADNPHIRKLPSGNYHVYVTITRHHKHCKTFPTLKQAEAHRDICVFERDFLKLRGLSYD